MVGLSNTVRLQSLAVRPASGKTPAKETPAAKSSSSSASCETGYVSTAELFDLVTNNVGFAYGYGGGPGCGGLTPSQTNSMYGAPHASPSTQGAGVTAAVFELSAYQASDIDTWAQHYYGKRYTAPLENVTVDGGPLAPVCPTGDTCPAEYNGYSGDVEVDADIEVTLAVSPDVKHLIVYNAPNDYTGQTELDEYTAIANQDVASTISSSWGECENDAGAGYVQAENTVFEQMALQGQSMFSSSGDTGAFGCIRSDGTTVVNANDPSSQPWVTSVGGTSFEGDNPGTNSNPGTPAKGTETVWNVDNLCSDQAAAADNDEQGGYFWCAETGAGGGGSSQFWGRPFYQRGPGVNSQTTPTRVRRSPTARRPARWPRRGRRAARSRTSRPWPTRTTATPSTARAARARPTATAPRSAAASRPRLVRDRRHQPVVPALGRADRRPRQLQRAPHRQHQPVGVLLVRHRPR